ncbi:YceI family protein [Cellulosimicrobium sp. CUA-896]|uniref:YceI family protein n=1 Tax=Cellulosimicrobium sp. CUA-896 TaxID=1517881 RepID=UPI000AF5A4E2
MERYDRSGRGDVRARRRAQAHRVLRAAHDGLARAGGVHARQRDDRRRCDPLASAVTATIEAASLTTHHPDRDVHLHSADFLDVEHHPTLEFRSTGVRWQGAQDDAILAWARLRNRSPERATVAAGRVASAEPGRFVVSGLLTIRGVTRPVALRMQYGGARRDPYGRDIFGFHATAEIDREDYGLVWNVLLETGGVLVGKKVQLEIAGEAIHQD